MQVHSATPSLTQLRGFSHSMQLESLRFWPCLALRLMRPAPSSEPGPTDIQHPALVPSPSGPCMHSLVCMEHTPFRLFLTPTQLWGALDISLPSLQGGLPLATPSPSLCSRLLWPLGLLPPWTTCSVNPYSIALRFLLPRFSKCAPKPSRLSIVWKLVETQGEESQSRPTESESAFWYDFDAHDNL